MTSQSTISIPVSTAGRRRIASWWWVASALAIIVLAGVALRWQPWAGGNRPPVTGQFYLVAPMDLEIKIVKDGELQASRFIDVENRVEGTTQILWLEKEGTTVEKGAELVRLDSSNLQQRKEQIDLDIKRAESNLRIAMEMKEIQESQNATLKEVAEVNVELARLDLKRYVEGVYPQAVADATTALNMARINLKNKEDDLDQTRSLYARGFVTAADVKKSELEVTQARNEVRKAETALHVLQNYTYPMELSRLRSNLAQSESRLARVMKENASSLAQRLAELDEKQSTLALLKRQAAKIQAQIDNCTIRAPEDGLVIYMSSIDRNQREMIQEGALVRYSQVLMRLPDVKNMKAVLKLQETQKMKLDVDRKHRAIVRILGVPNPIGATLTRVAPLPDSSQRWWNPDLKEYPVELALDETPPGLKPGTRCDVEILIDRRENVLAVPLAAIYTAGGNSYVFVRNGEGVKERRVKVGVATETHVEIQDGLSEGEEVMLLQPGQGRLLLESAGIKADDPTTRPARSNRSRRRMAPNDGIPNGTT